MTERNEEAVWLAFRGGSETAFTEIYNAYFKVLYHYGYHIASDENLVKDCIQNLFIELWKSRQNLSATTSIKFYLFRAMRRKLYQTVRRDKPLLSIDPLTDTYDTEVNFSPEFNLIASEISAQQRQQIEQAINRLSNRQKEAITLLYIEGLSYAEISEIMTLKVRTVYNLVHTALENLRAYLNQPATAIWLTVGYLLYP
ncbi:RNA polymerase sigma factor [Larkinella insperata]|uniref:RNA polymerase sigma factor n=1 Tax=Larkinella insperata TaxID=332158 RepID=A0ABW3Q8Z3_9BACT|nr:RNA polymerase sigma factor [Larkinella insperata]